MPGESNNFGKRAVVRLDIRGDMFVVDEGGAEKDEGIGGTRDMVLRFLLSMCLPFS